MVYTRGITLAPGVGTLGSEKGDGLCLATAQDNNKCLKGIL